MESKKIIKTTSRLAEKKSCNPDEFWHFFNTLLDRYAIPLLLWPNTTKSWIYE